MKDVIVEKGNLDGKGVYAGRDFQKGEVVVKYNLKEISKDTFDKLPEGEKQFVHSHNGKLFLYSEPERYVNHSHDPNTYQDFENGCDRALRNIKKGKMITTDATKDDFN